MLLRARLESLGRAPRSGGRSGEIDLESLAHTTGGEVRENARGAYVVIEELLPLPPRPAYDAAGAGWLAGLPGIELGEGGIGFFDTETTGLSGGVGTSVFLLALGRRLPAGFLLRQYLLPDPALEDPFLEAIADDLGACEALVSYNGRSFDVPVVEGRLLLSRRKADCLHRPHLDLLHPARRLYKARLGACNLQNVEAMVLGQDRGDDIPGYLIPEMYFSYLRDRDAHPLLPVIAHNRQDVVSLSLLLDRLMTSLRDHDAAHPLDRFGLGRMLEAMGEVERAVLVYASLWEESDGAWNGEVWPGTWTPDELAYVVGLRLATLHRRRGAVDDGAAIARALWQRHPQPWEAGIMLAKHLEHRRKDRVAALEVVLAAVEALESIPWRQGREERCLADLRRRSVRLSRPRPKAA
ncbi:MAG: ribonuclease H-like domain-containing protein [Candidatus Dormibacteraeota bacterium]|nr:ribonuclease H-like domain-containing protein [Candidatus Dormibacteraeota bacterium]